MTKAYAPFQLTAARRRLAATAAAERQDKLVSTHSRPKAAGVRLIEDAEAKLQFQLTAARRRLELGEFTAQLGRWFQLTAARRRLVPPLKPLTGKACIALFR